MRNEYEAAKLALASVTQAMSPWSLAFYLRKGLSEVAAKAALAEAIAGRAKSATHPSQTEHYLKQGFSSLISEQRARAFRQAIGRVPTQACLSEQFGEAEGAKRWAEYQARLKGRVGKFLARYDDAREANVMQCLTKGFGNTRKCRLEPNSFRSYSKYCRTLTRLSLAAYGNEIDPTGEKLGRDYGKAGFVLDHRFSIYGGFHHRVDPFKICARSNLALVSKAESTKKSQFCDISLEDLLSFKTILEEAWLSTATRQRILDVYR